MTIPAGYAQATFVFNGPGVPTGAVSTLGFDDQSANTPTQTADALRVAFDDNITPLLTEDVGLFVVNVKYGPEDTGAMASSSTGDPGADTSEGAPPSVAYLVTKTTGLGGRRGRGRMFIPGVDETEVSVAGAVSSGKRNALQAGFDQFYDDLLTADLVPYLLHDPATEWVLVDGQPRRVVDTGAAAPPDPTLITGFSVSGTVATQRRRLRR